ncbi:hypothetical protein ACERJO_16650 [Halalkalibacter sp. AB-rgal2]|uniref:hypothetical protein n=1 Tax=Halalkalibacter sp. AB-rgal2 TaxID=3242695 RepID=UPI00359D8154
MIFNEESFRITGSFGNEWSYNEIKSVNLLDELPEIRGRVFGRGTMRESVGHHTLNDASYNTALLFILKDSPPYIFIELKEEKPIFINGSSAEETNNWFELLHENSP